MVEFDPKELPRVNFRDKVIGPTEHKDAPKDSLRGAALANRNGLETFGVDADDLDKINSEAKESGNLVKLGRGLYCAHPAIRMPPQFSFHSSDLVAAQYLVKRVPGPTSRHPRKLDSLMTRWFLDVLR